MKTAKIIMLCIIFSTISFVDNLSALSATVQTRQDYSYTLRKIRYLNIAIQNFGDDAAKLEFEKIKKLFSDSSENYYGRNYFKSFAQFRKVKTDLVLLTRKMAKSYLERTKEILDSVAKESHEILIDYSKDSSLAEFFKHPFDPFKDVKTYEPNKYHYFHDREKIEAYLDNGFKNYHEAKKVFNDPDVNYMLTKKNVPSKGLNFIIDKYILTIDLCRTAKTLGIAIYKIKNLQKIEDIINKYNIHTNRLYPVFDERIPDKYKVDASDNKFLIHSIELRKVQENKK